MNPFNFFDKTYCLNQASRPERWQQAEQEFKKVGVNAERFLSLDDENNCVSFCNSMLSMFKDAHRLNVESILIFEDDVIFKDTAHLGLALMELPENWDVLYLGANIIENRPRRFNTHLWKLEDAWTTHAIAYRKPFIKYVAENYVGYDMGMFDVWLSAQNKTHNSFIVGPMICYQRPGKSGIWNTITDYTQTFVNSDHKLR